MDQLKDSIVPEDKMVCLKNTIVEDATSIAFNPHRDYNILSSNRNNQIVLFSINSKRSFISFKLCQINNDAYIKLPKLENK